jgi:DNA polymerase I-like protein with 3'-5' exonuclease and polymerase domains
MDLHEWNIKNIYRGLGTREEAKKRVFAWLYNPNSDDHLTSRYYDRGKVKESFFSDGKVKTIFNREIESDDYHAFNYIIQSTTSDLFMKQMIKVHDFLKDKKSFIAFLIHDSLVIDFDKSELDHTNEIRQLFSQTIFGDFQSSIKIGKNYGEMKEWKL